MAYRLIQDPRGEEWEVWQVIPSLTDRQRKAETEPLHTGVSASGFVSSELQSGWLAFQSRGEKRRLAPIPLSWEEMPDAELLALLSTAESTGKPARLIE